MFLLIFAVTRQFAVPVKYACYFGILVYYVMREIFAYYFDETYLLTPWSRVLLEKLTGSQPVKKLPAVSGTRKFITVFTSALHLSLS